MCINTFVSRQLAFTGLHDLGKWFWLKLSDCREISQVLIDHFERHLVYKIIKKIIDDHRNFEINISNAVISTVPADGLAAKAAAVTVIVKTRFHIYILGRNLKGYNCSQIIDMMTAPLYAMHVENNKFLFV